MALKSQLLYRDWLCKSDETFTSSASACQCRGCGRWPWRIRLAYQRDTPIFDRMAAVEMFASCGWIFRENTSLVSQAGWLDASQDERAFACRRSDSECLARASELRAATRPIRAAFMRRSVAVATAQFAQWVRPSLIGFPQPRQRFSILGVTTTGVVGCDRILTGSRLLLCVRRVGGKSLCVRLRVVDHKCRTSVSATGPMARAHTWAVSVRRMANDAIKRQFPSRRSKNHSRRSGWLRIQSST